MSEVRLDKVTLNIGAGGGDRIENARSLLERISGGKAVITRAKARNPSFKIRKGDEIGAKITLRGEKAGEVLKRALETVDHLLPPKSFDSSGNVSFGIKEYIDFPGMKYDPKIGMMGFELAVTLKKAGSRIALRRIAKKKLPVKQRVSREEAMKFMQEQFNARMNE